MISLTKEDLKKYKLHQSEEGHHNNNGTIYIDVEHNLIYKLVDIDYFFPDEFNRNIEFQIENPIPNTPMILDKLSIDGKYTGYVMTYIPNSMTFRQALQKEIPNNQKQKAIYDIFTALKELHNHNLTLGDIHMDNFLISPTGGTIIDLDYMRFPGDEFKFMTCYDVVNQKKYTQSGKYTDSIKTAIVAISLLIGIDLEKELITKSNLYIHDLEEYLKSYPELKDFVEHIKNREEPFYFDDYLKEYTSKNKKV